MTTALQATVTWPTRGNVVITITVDLDGKQRNPSTETLRKHHKRLRHKGPNIALDFDAIPCQSDTAPDLITDHHNSQMLCWAESPIIVPVGDHTGSITNHHDSQTLHQA
ncbi:hypothetical protein LguiA_021194 [Lonicera macranthoides]